MYNEIDLDKIDLNSAPPMEEPARQYYYIAMCRKWVQEFEQENGRRPTACVQTFGCQMNVRDSEKITGILLSIGYQMAENEKADFVLCNTCTVRENANQKVYGHLGFLKKEKEKNPSMIIALCGCMMQEAQVVEKIRESYRFVDLVFGTHNIFKLAELICGVFSGREAAQRSPYRKNGKWKVRHTMLVDIWDEAGQAVEALPEERIYPFKASVNIMYGCNNFCSYCIVPYVRGRERSRTPEDIVRELRQLSEEGVVEVMLLGQNVNSYGKTLDPPVSFAELLRQAEQVEGIRRIRFMTPHPKDFSDELIDVIAHSKKICRHLHLPLQSGSTEVLRKMNRRYTKGQYLELVGRIRAALPELSLTTDIIVGFPGETEEDFMETLDVVRQVRYDAAYTFQYSKRTGTPAAAMEGQVPEDVVSERFGRLLRLVSECSAERAALHTGSVAEVLVEEAHSQDPSLLTGRLGNNLLVHFPGSPELIGQFVPVRLVECKGFYYMGELMKA